MKAAFDNFINGSGSPEALSEAVTNCIIHAYDSTEGIIKIEAKLTNNSIEIEISLITKES